jgi:hypothetical protein
MKLSNSIDQNIIMQIRQDIHMSLLHIPDYEEYYIHSVGKQNYSYDNNLKNGFS